MIVLAIFVVLVVYFAVVVFIGVFCGMTDETPQFPKHLPRSNVRLVRDEDDAA